MTDHRLARLEECLWPRGSIVQVWMILDAARDPAILPLLRSSSLQNTCLYSGAVPRALGVVAPYLVQLDRDNPVTHRLLSRAWGNSWGVFLESDAKLAELRRHLRTFLMVRDPRGNQLLFRYYDPRVLRVYLPTCHREELHRVFGPVERFWTEHQSPNTLLEFTFRLIGLRTRTHDLDRAEAVTPQDPADEWSRRSTLPYPGALMIRSEQLDVFAQHERHKFEDWLMAHVTRFFPRESIALGGESQMRDLIHYGVERSATYGITTKRDVCKYVDLMMVLGRNFDADGRFSWALKQPWPASDKVSALYAVVKSRLSRRQRMSTK